MLKAMTDRSDISSLLTKARAVFFDIDGTLVDSNEFHILAWDEAFRENGRSVERRTLREQIGKGADVLIPSLFPDAMEAEQKKLSDAHSEIFKARFLELVRPFPHAVDLINALHRRGVKVLLVSSSDTVEVEHYAKLLDVAKILNGVVSFDDVNRTKPAGDLFAVALEKAAISPTKALAIGDTPYDAEAAGKCCVPSIGLRTGGFEDEQLWKAGASAIATDIGTLFESL